MPTNEPMGAYHGALETAREQYRSIRAHQSVLKVEREKLLLEVEQLKRVIASLEEMLGDTPLCGECGEETCAHGGCRDPHCRYFCHQCQRERDAAREAAYQRDVAGPLLGLDEEGTL